MRSNSCLAMNIDSLLSALLTGSFQNQTTASCLLADAAANETTTSSFSGDSVDNQPSNSKRKRGVNALLNDATNIKPASKRRCATKASSNISQQKKYAPRGNPSVGGSNRAKAIKEPKVKAGQQIKTPESQTLQQVLIRDNKHLTMDFNVLAISLRGMQAWKCTKQ